MATFGKFLALLPSIIKVNCKFWTHFGHFQRCPNTQKLRESEKNEVLNKNTMKIEAHAPGEFKKSIYLKQSRRFYNLLLQNAWSLALMSAHPHIYIL